MSTSIALLRIAPLVLSTCVLRFSMDKLLFLWIFLHPRLAKHTNAVLPPYLDIFTTRKSYILSAFYPVLIATGLANRYLTQLSPQASSSAAWWYDGGTLLALLHFAFTARLNSKAQAIIAMTTTSKMEDKKTTPDMLELKQRNTNGQAKLITTTITENRLKSPTMATGENTTKVLVTGFGPFLDIAKNPSYEIVCRLPQTLSSGNVTIIAHPEPIPAAYHKIADVVPRLIVEHDPDIVVHMGLAVERDYFAVERSAPKEGYHEIPDIARRVFTRAENKALFGRSAASLAIDLPLEEVVDSWKDSVAQARLRLPCSSSSSPASAAGKAQGGGKKGKGAKDTKKKEEQKEVDVRLSDDVGTYDCGFIYYLSLLEMGKRGKKRNTVFFHVPPLKTEDEVQIGLKVTVCLVQALADTVTKKGT
ncbi:hypothetical protein PG994_005616 [Apiospora phragmitis]|uniref:Peptidase C15, pyroglutamyl peptidase I-like protein n=1 Tax=Apiospora phragmitis TaxID=2905665 RepID=A0ABR1VCS7_9PEZI